MKGRPIDHLVYEALFPNPKPTDPNNFHAFLQRHLILEVRQEVHSFYGHLDTPEAKYPGLDYCHRIHRIRLSRWPWHRKLFRVFDALRLTPNEIAGLTKWEGTKWAKERFEREQGFQIRDTTADVFERRNQVDEETASAAGSPTPQAESVDVDEGSVAVEDMDEDSDDGAESMAPAIYRRLQEQADLRERGGSTAIIDDEWEQWFKSVVENGELASIVISVLRQPGDMRRVPPTRLFPQTMLNAARSGRWNEIPDFLHDVLRYALEVENAESDEPEDDPSRPSPPTPAAMQRYSGRWQDGFRRSFSDLRLPNGGQRAAPPPGA